MRKKAGIMLAVVLAVTMALSVFAFTGCGGSKIELNKESVTITVGQEYKLVATPANEKDADKIQWKSEKGSVAVVDENGKVTGMGAGTTTISAFTGDKPGKNAATCEVTVVEIKFTADGQQVTDSLTVDRNKAPVQLAVQTSDKSSITSWMSGDPSIISVDNTGKVTALKKEGRTTITARTSSGISATLNVEATDSFTGTMYYITGTGGEKRWWYAVNTIEENRNITIEEAEVRGDNVTFEYGGGTNWYIDDVILGYNGGAANGWQIGMMTIESSVDAYITVNTTTVHLLKGTNEVSVCVDGSQDLTIRFANARFGNYPGAARVVISGLVFSPHTLTKLDAPAFELNGDGITITDPNLKGADSYQVGLFKSGATNPSHIQSVYGNTGKLDTSTIEEKGEYTVRARTVGAPGYETSDWSTATDTVTVNNESVKYDLESGAASDAMQSSRWYYYGVDGGQDGNPNGTYEDGTLTFNSTYLGWAFYSTQLFRNYAQFENNTELLATININVSASDVEEFAGHVTICGAVKELKNGDNYIEIKRTQSDNEPTMSIQFGVYGATPPCDFPEDSELTFTFTDIDVKPLASVEIKPLTAPSATIDAATKTVTVTDENDAKYVGGYKLGFYDGNDLIREFDVESGSVIDDRSLPNGDYTLKIRAVASQIRYTDSDVATVAAYTVNNEGGQYYELAFGGDGDTPNAKSDKNYWYYWNDQDWTGSTVVIGDEENKAEFKNNSVVIPYTVTAGASDYGLQVYYKNAKLAVGQDYKLTLKLSSEEAVSVRINGTDYALEKGENDIAVFYKEEVGIGYSFSMQVKVNAGDVSKNTLTLSEMKWEEYTYIDLKAPTLSVDDDGIVSITDPNEDGVAGYIVNFYKNDIRYAFVKAENGEKLDVSKVATGDYTLKIIAQPAPGYNASAESAGFEYHVENDHVVYDLPRNEDGTYGFGGDAAANQPGTWGVWAGPGEWTGWASIATVHSATYEDGKITINFDLTGNNTWGFQVNYVSPDFKAGTRYTFDIVCDKDIDIQVESGGAAVTHLAAGQSRHLSGGGDASFYIQVNVTESTPINNATLIISNVVWQ